MKKWTESAHCDPEQQPHCEMCLRGEWRNQGEFYELPDECPYGLTLEDMTPREEPDIGDQKDLRDCDSCREKMLKQMQGEGDAPN